MAATGLLLYCRQSGLDESLCRLLLPPKHSRSSRAAASANGGALRYCGIKRCGISARTSRAASHDVSLRKLPLLLNHFRSPRAAASANGGALRRCCRCFMRRRGCGCRSGRGGLQLGQEGVLVLQSHVGGGHRARRSRTGGTSDDLQRQHSLLLLLP